MSDCKSTSQGRSLLLNLIFLRYTHCEDSSVEKMKHLLTLISFCLFSGLVVSNELTNTNVLIQDVFTLLFQVPVPVLYLIFDFGIFFPSPNEKQQQQILVLFR
jgi:hypothetical protein